MNHCQARSVSAEVCVSVLKEITSYLVEDATEERDS